MCGNNGERGDAELFDAWVGGDRLAGRMLFERHFDTAYFFFRGRAPGAVDDLVQQTFLGCIEARERFRRDASFRTFLLAIARHKLFGYYRAGRSNDEFAASIADTATSPSGSLARRQEQSALAAALRALPLELQEVLELAYWGELDGPELAEVIEIPLNTVYSRLRRAKELLRNRLERQIPDPDQHGILEDVEQWAARVRALREPKS